MESKILSKKASNKMNAQKQRNFYYMHNGKRFDNMKDCIEGIGNGTVKRRNFKHMLQLGIVKKYVDNKEVTINPNPKINKSWETNQMNTNKVL